MSEDMEPEFLDRILIRHKRELADAVKAERAAIKAAGKDASLAVRGDALEALTPTLANLRTQRQRDRSQGSLLATPMYSDLAVSLAAQLREVEMLVVEGEPVAAIVVPRPNSFGYQERVAWAVVAISKEVWR